MKIRKPRSSRVIILFVVFFFGLVVVTPAYCTLLMYEPFNYVVGEVLTDQGQAPQVWEDTGQAPRTIAAGDLAPDTWTGFFSSGNHVGPDAKGLVNRLLVPTPASNLWAKDGTGGTIYVSAVLKGNNNLGLKSQDGTTPLLNMQFDTGGMTAYAQYANGDGSSESQTNLGTSGGSAKIWVWKIEHDGGDGSDTMSAFLSKDPNLDFSVEPAFTPLSSKQQNHDSAMYWYADIAYGDNLSSIDELRIGETWEDVIGLGTTVAPDPEIFTWNTDEIGSWNVAANWSPWEGPPHMTYHTAVFGDKATVPTLVGVTSSVTVNRIEFSNSNSYAIGGLGTVSLESSTRSGATPSLTVSEGSHEFQAGVHLGADTTVDVVNDSTLTFNNTLNLNGHTLTKAGVGTMSIRNDFVKGTGTLIITEGTVSGNGTVAGSVDNSGGTIAPGNSPGILTIDGNLNNGASGTIAVEIEGTSGAGDSAGHDQIQVTGSSTLDGTLSITTGSYADPTTRAVRDTFTVIASAGGSTGAFGTVSYDGVDLSADFNGSNGSFRDHIENGLFRNVNYDGNNVSVTNLFALEGDADGDIDIDITDFNILASNFDDTGANSATNDWTTADFDADGDIDITDFNFLASNFAPDSYRASNAIPEPSSFILCVLGILVVSRFVSRREVG